MKKSHKKQLLNIAFVVLLAGLTFLMLFLSSDELNMESLTSFFADCNLWLIAAAVGCMLLYIVMEAASLHIILYRFGHRPRLSASLAYSASDVYYSAITPSATGGQPASAFYMIRDGVSGGTACFALVFNLLAYTASLLTIGTVVLALNFPLFLSFSIWVKLFIIAGFVAQLSLLFLFIACIRHPGAVLRLGNFLITVLVRIRIIRKEEKWRGKLDRMVKKYRGCYECFQHQRGLFWQVFLCNVLQRASLIFVSALVCFSATDCSLWDMFVMQTFAMIGYNSIPLPGGSGAYEFLYINIYEKAFGSDFILIAMMVTRVISYYLSMLLSGLYTALYHVLAPNRRKEAASPADTQAPAAVAQEVTSTETEGDSNEKA
ncbi:MAG: flippase-like domain-containing protein [Ruminococcaceae bacterium]|nr:flippase-like domain-containing protein [Oscillospiraceae bacterium]